MRLLRVFALLCCHCSSIFYLHARQKSPAPLFAYIAFAISSLYACVWLCGKFSKKKVAVIIVEEEYVSSSVTHCCLLQQSAQPLHCSLTRVFSALFNAFFCHSKLITASANTHCIEVLQEIYHFRFFFLQKQEIYGVEKKALTKYALKSCVVTFDLNLLPLVVVTHIYIPIYKAIDQRFHCYINIVYVCV